MSIGSETNRKLNAEMDMFYYDMLPQQIRDHLKYISGSVCSYDTYYFWEMNQNIDATIKYIDRELEKFIRKYK